MATFAECSSFLVECYWPGVSREKLLELTDRAAKATEELRRSGRDVSLLESILVLKDETVFCIFSGCERDVRIVSARAGVPLERIVESVRVPGGRKEQQ